MWVQAYARQFVEQMPRPAIDRLTVGGTAIKRTRRKLGDEGEIIRTHVGLGYSIGYGG